MAMRIKYDPFPCQILGNQDAGIFKANEDQWGVLDDLGHEDHGVALLANDQQPGIGHPVMGLAGKDLIDMIGAGARSCSVTSRPSSAKKPFSRAA